MGSSVSNCPFCEDKILAASFAASSHFRAIYNLAPILPGHSLIIPEFHYQSLLDMPEELLGEMMIFSRKVVLGLRKIFNANGFNWTIQDGTSAGQTVFHVHLHLVPRQVGDLPEPGDWYPRVAAQEQNLLDSELRPKLSDEEMQQIVKYLRQFYA